MLECGFKSRLGLESPGLSIHVAFSEARCHRFSPGTPVSSLPSSINDSVNKNKAGINAI